MEEISDEDLARTEVVTEQSSIVQGKGGSGD